MSEPDRCPCCGLTAREHPTPGGCPNVHSIRVPYHGNPPPSFLPSKLSGGFYIPEDWPPPQQAQAMEALRAEFKARHEGRSNAHRHPIRDDGMPLPPMECPMPRCPGYGSLDHVQPGPGYCSGWPKIPGHAPPKPWPEPGPRVEVAEPKKVPAEGGRRGWIMDVDRCSGSCYHKWQAESATLAGTDSGRRYYAVLLVCLRCGLRNEPHAINFSEVRAVCGRRVKPEVYAAFGLAAPKPWVAADAVAGAVWAVPLGILKVALFPIRVAWKVATRPVLAAWRVAAWPVAALFRSDTARVAVACTAVLFAIAGGMAAVIYQVDSDRCRRPKAAGTVESAERFGDVILIRLRGGIEMMPLHVKLTDKMPPPGERGYQCENGHWHAEEPTAAPVAEPPKVEPPRPKAGGEEF